MAEIRATYGTPKADGTMDPAVFITTAKDENCDEQKLVAGFRAGLNSIEYWLTAGNYQLIRKAHYTAPEGTTKIKYEINVADAKRIWEAIQERNDLRRKVDNLRRQNKGLRTQIKKLKSE